MHQKFAMSLYCVVLLDYLADYFVWKLSPSATADDNLP